MSFTRLWFAFATVVLLSFAVLGWTGLRIYQQAPPVTERVVTTAGVELIGPDRIHAGQNVWQSMGGMEVGSVWGQLRGARLDGRLAALTAKPLTAEQLAKIEAIAPRGAIAGTRYPAAHMTTLDSEKR